MKHKHFKHLFTVLLLLCYVSVGSFAYTPLSLKGSNVKAVKNGTTVKYTDNLVVLTNGISNEPQKTDITVEQKSDSIYKFTMSNISVGEISEIVADNVVVEEIDGVKYFTATQIRTMNRYGTSYTRNTLFSGKMNDEKLYLIIEFEYDYLITFGRYFSTGHTEFNINVPSAGQLGHLLLNEIEQWADVESLTLSGNLNTADLAYLSRLTNLSVLDLSQTNITSMTGCKGLSRLQTVMLPSIVVTVENDAFHGCKLLNSISLPNVVSIGNSAFAGCESLTEANLPNVVSIGNSAFAGCKSLTETNLPNVVSIGYSAFGNCKSLTSIDLPKAESLGESVFSNCKNLIEANLPNVVSIECDAFNQCVNLSKVTMSKVRVIPRYCFCECYSLKNFDFPASLETIDDYAFRGCNLTEAILPEGLECIYGSAFEGCPLTVISIPSTVTVIENYAFTTSKVTDVYCYSVAPVSTDVFSSMSQATLYVPEFSVNTYRLHDDWYSFAKIVPLEGDLEKLNINNEFAIYDYAGLADKIDMTLSFGEKYLGDYSIAKLTVNANSALSLGKYEQYQDLYNYDYDYYDGVYSYCYCTTLVTQNDITADSVCTHLYMRDGRWNFISFPYDVNVSDIVVPEGVLWVIRKYSGSDRAAMTGNTWQNMTDGMTLKAGEGYIFHCYYEEGDKVCVSFPSASSDTGTLFAHNDVNRVLDEYPAEYAHNRSWNLVGNPYPSYFNTRDMEFNAPITVWNGNGYTAYSLLDDNYVLTPNEAFFVQRPAESNSIVFKKEGRLHYLDSIDLDSIDNDDEYRASPAQRTGKSLPSRSVYNFLLENAEYSDRARLVVNEDAKMDYEINCDAGKFMSSNADVPQLYINDSGVLYAINERPLGSGVIGMGAYFGKDGEYTLSLQENPNNNFSVILTDQLTGCKTDLSVGDYTFNAPAGTCNNRFTITLENTTDIEECVEDEDSAGDIYTLDGKKVTNVDNLPAGVYLVKNGNKYVKRVITE